MRLYELTLAGKNEAEESTQRWEATSEADARVKASQLGWLVSSITDVGDTVAIANLTKMEQHLRTIRNWVIFWSVTSVIGLIILIGLHSR